MERQTLKRPPLAMALVIVVVACAFVLLTPVEAEAKETVVTVGGEQAANLNLDRAKLEELIHLELGANADTITTVTIELEVEPRRAASVVLVRTDGTSKRGVIEIVATVTDDAERTIALFVGELSRSNAMPPASPEPPPPKPPPQPSKPTANDNAPKLAIGGTLRFAGIGSGGTALMFGPTIAASVGVLGDHIRFGVVGRAMFTSADDALGTVSATQTGGGVDAAYRLIGTQRLLLDTGPRIVVSRIAGAGSGKDATVAQTTTTRQTTSAALGVETAWFVDASLILANLDFAQCFAALALEGGWIGPGLDLRADDRRVLRIAGVFVGTMLTIGLSF